MLQSGSTRSARASNDPGAFPVAPDLVEALVELGRVDEARTVTARLTELAEQQEHPWGRVAALRCRALVAARVADRSGRGGVGTRGRGGCLRASSAFASTTPGRCSSSGARSAGAGSGPQRGSPSSMPPPPSTRSARRDGLRKRVGSSRGSARGVRRRARRANAGAAARGRAGGGGAVQQGDRKRTLRHRAHGRSAPLARVRKARRSVTGAARGPPLRPDVASSKFEGFRDFAEALSGVASSA